MEKNTNTLPQLAGQWIDLVTLKGPVQLPSRPKQMIDSYSTIWQVGDQLWAGDGFGSVTPAGVVTMYDQQAQYENGEIVWPGQQGLNAYVRTVDLTGMWVDQLGQTHELAQKTSPVTLTLSEVVLGQNLVGKITGHEINFTNTQSGAALSAKLSTDCFEITWSDGSTWRRHLHIAGDWISIKNKCHLNILAQNLDVMISDIPGYVDLTNWYINASDEPFPDNKTKGGIDFDSTAIHWTDYVGWQRFFNLTGAWLDQNNKVHALAKQRLKDPMDYRRFTWLFDSSEGKTGSIMRNWIELTDANTTQHGFINYNCNRIHWENGAIWKKQ